jgi:hypothetical protein
MKMVVIKYLNRRELEDSVIHRPSSVSICSWFPFPFALVLFLKGLSHEMNIFCVVYKV